jgi:hypothetical protein
MELHYNTFFPLVPWLSNSMVNLYLRINIFIREKNIGFPWFCSLLAFAKLKNRR